MGERDAVPSKTGQPVHQSGPGLNEPTLSPTSGLKPEARPPLQPKTGRGVGQSPTGREAALPSFLEEIEIDRNTSGGGTRTAKSCRLCLIACNSRHIDEAIAAEAKVA